MITQQQALEALERVYADATHAAFTDRNLVRQYIEQGAQPGADVVMVPRSAIEWLMGEGDSFEPPADQRLFRGKVPPYWWRSEFRRRAALSAAPQPQQEQSK